MIDPLRSIPPVDRSVPAVELRRLTPIEREEERQRREREREKRRREQPDEPDRTSDGRLDIRA
jgi:hypothetical protein